ncbi:tetratricopeptide repeat protein [Rubellicoccus peritrichatus]|uniref:Tetratricopeptide repeat protein n=1 Tax=Rubellicoccus peritrichatus TaxID=3080537 RepID=A0AAQ3LF16_9BACT|nr:tetratricopeptide repeat protein [Puniceicoccus sp. CR14]WOO42715.1 tetratricopeptide repeat protein [Puniceicoccus sp. CR14]
MKKFFYIYLLLVPFILDAQRGPLWETSWQNPEFIKRFTGSYGFDGPREPTITRDEQQLFTEISQLLKQNNLATASARLQASINADSSAALNYTLGNIFFQSGQLPAAEQSYRDALRKFPGFVRAQKNLGLTLMQAGRFDEAQPYLIKTIEGEGGDGSVYSMLAYTYFNDERYSSALQAYEEALLYDPDNVEWQIGLAQALYATEQYKEAAAAFEELLQANPEREELWLMQANAWLSLDEPERAAANLEVVRRLGRASSQALVLLGDIYISDGMAGLAAIAYEEAFSSDNPPGANEALRAASLFADRGSWDQAQQIMGVIEQNYQAKLDAKQASEFLNLKAQVAMALGDSENAALTLRSLLDRDPMNAKALLMLAEYEWMQGEIEEAELLYERAARVPEKEVDAYVQHARMLVAQKDYAAAERLLKKAQTLEPRENVARYLDGVERARKSSY